MVAWKKKVTGIDGDKMRKMERFLKGSGGRGGKERERSGSLENIRRVVEEEEG